MFLLRATLLAIALGSALPAKAETWLTLNCCSKHWRVGDHHYNESNYGIGLNHVLPSGDSVIAGNYLNSFERISAYAAYAPRTWGTSLWGLTVESRIAMGVVTGYGETDEGRQKYGPLLMPILSARGKDVGVSIIGVPGILLGFMLEVRLP